MEVISNWCELVAFFMRFFFCKNANSFDCDTLLPYSRKQEISIGKQNNQSFVSIPFQKLRETIRMAANREGIPVVMQDESYTSKASCLDQDPVLYYKEGETPPEFSGKRTRRGL